MIRVAIIGASGYTGAESIKILLGHNEAELTYLTAIPAECGAVEDIFPQFRGRCDLQIEPLDLPRVSDEVFLVVSELEFHPDSKARLRRKNNRIAILVLKEDDQWRMMPAPSELQPPEEDTPTTTSAPTTTAPSYPWDQDGDF